MHLGYRYRWVNGDSRSLGSAFSSLMVGLTPCYSNLDHMYLLFLVPFRTCAFAPFFVPLPTRTTRIWCLARQVFGSPPDTNTIRHNQCSGVPTVHDLDRHARRWCWIQVLTPVSDHTSSRRARSHVVSNRFWPGAHGLWRSIVVGPHYGLRWCVLTVMPSRIDKTWGGLRRSGRWRAWQHAWHFTWREWCRADTVFSQTSVFLCVFIPRDEMVAKKAIFFPQPINCLQTIFDTFQGLYHNHSLSHLIHNTHHIGDFSSHKTFWPPTNTMLHLLTFLAITFSIKRYN